MEKEMETTILGFITLNPKKLSYAKSGVLKTLNPACRVVTHCQKKARQGT